MDVENELMVQKEGSICTIVINRPEKRNLLTPTCLLKMSEVIEELTKEGNVLVIIIRGAEDKAFCAGYDISALPTKPTSQIEADLKETPPLERALQAIRKFPYPVIAMLNGYAYGGGCELAIGCDIRIAARRIKMGMPPAKIGLVYPYSGYRRFFTVLGFSRTLEIFLTGRKYDSKSCLQMGLVNHVVDDGTLEDFTYNLAREITENAPLSLQGTKFTLYKIAENPILEKKDEDEIRSLFIKSLQSEDMSEGQWAFFEKIKPRFKGR
jgi:enoyl-CoA hydratase/carnithine racemase